MHGRRLADLDLSVALDSGRAERVLESAERARAVASRLPAVRPPEDPDAAQLLAELRQTVEALRQAEQHHQPDAELAERRHDLEARIAARGWSRAGGGVVRDVVEVDEVRAVLGDSTLVSFSRADDVLHAVSSMPTGCGWSPSAMPSPSTSRCAGCVPTSTCSPNPDCPRR